MKKFKKASKNQDKMIKTQKRREIHLFSFIY